MVQVMGQLENNNSYSLTKENDPKRENDLTHNQ